MRKIVITTILIFGVLSLISAGSINDTIKNTQTPYIADKGRFESLFINPAGIAGQTDAFNLSLFGTVTVPPNILELLDTAESLSGQAEEGSMDAETAADVANVLAETLTQSDVDLLLADTALSGFTIEQLQEYDYTALSDVELETLSEELQSEEKQSIALSAFDNVAQIYGTASVKLGTLLRGFGVSVYTSEGFTLSMGNQGFEYLATETGLQAGLGMELGTFSIGASADFALLTLHENINLVENPDIMAAPMGYAYSYGVDVGAQWNILPSLTLGAVVSNLIGSSPLESSDYTATTAQDLLDGNLASVEKAYIFSTDLDLGLTWAPNTPGWFKPTLSADYYDAVSLFTGSEELSLDEALSHLRLGANLHFLLFDFGAQYYNEYLTLGAGIDLAVLQVYMEATTNQEVTDLGGSVLVKLKF